MTRQPLLKYKIGLGLIGLLAAVLLVVVIIQAHGTKQDERTYQQATKISDKLNDYVDSKNTIPVSLAEAHIINVPKTISYHRLGKDKYTFCIRYRTESSSYSGFRKALSVVDGAGYYPSSDASYEDTALYLSPGHHKGFNCVTVKPQLIVKGAASQSAATLPYVKNADGTYTVCGVHTNYFDGEGHVLQGPPLTPGSISISATSGPYVGARQLFMISAGSQEFDESCTPLTPNDLHTGDTVSVFDITSPNAAAISIYLKRSY